MNKRLCVNLPWAHRLSSRCGASTYVRNYLPHVVLNVEIWHNTNFLRSAIRSLSKVVRRPPQQQTRQNSNDVKLHAHDTRLKRNFGENADTVWFSVAFVPPAYRLHHVRGAGENCPHYFFACAQHDATELTSGTFLVRLSLWVHPRFNQARHYGYVGGTNENQAYRGRPVVVHFAFLVCRRVDALLLTCGS